MGQMKSARLNGAPVFERLEYPNSDRRISEALVPGDAVGRFADLANDVALGVQAVLEITLEESARRERRADDPEAVSSGDRPLLSPFLLTSLQRLALRSAQDLVAESERVVTWAEEYHTPSAKKLRAAA